MLVNVQLRRGNTLKLKFIRIYVATVQLQAEALATIEIIYIYVCTYCST
jgi:hypothetical protein